MIYVKLRMGNWRMDKKYRGIYNIAILFFFFLMCIVDLKEGYPAGRVYQT